jgi:hypothetical protein
MSTYEIAAATWIGAVLLALCGVPQAFAAWRKPESTRGLSWLFLAAWGLGEIFMLYGMLGFVSLHVAANYAGNIVLVCYIAGVKNALPKRSGSEH